MLEYFAKFGHHDPGHHKLYLRTCNHVLTKQVSLASLARVAEVARKLGLRDPNLSSRMQDQVLRQQGR